MWSDSQIADISNFYLAPLCYNFLLYVVVTHYIFYLNWLKMCQTSVEEEDSMAIYCRNWMGFSEWGKDFRKRVSWLWQLNRELNSIPTSARAFLCDAIKSFKTNLIVYSTAEELSTHSCNWSQCAVCFELWKSSTRLRAKETDLLKWAPKISECLWP